MGMPIDEAINHLGNYSSTNGSGLTTDKQHNEAKRVAIETMRKYQKIEQILDDYDLEAWEVLENVKKVVEDGNN